MKQSNHSHAKRISACAVAGIALNLALNGWEQPLQLLIGSLLFTLAGVISGYLYETRRLPRPLLSLMDRLVWLSANGWGRSVLRFFGEHVVLVFGVIVVAGINAIAPDVESLPGHAQAIHQAAKTVGTFWLVVSALWQGVLTTVGQRHGSGPLMSFIERSVMIALALVLVRYFGVELSELIDVAKADPDGAIHIGFAVALVFGIATFAPKRITVLMKAEAVSTSGFAVSAPSRSPRDASDILRTAIHEAGHLLMFAGLSKLPPDLTVSVAAELGNEDMFRGMVRHSGDAQEGLLESEIRRLMLMLLAGSEAESLLLDNRGDGAQLDNAKWLNAANHYLMAGFGEVFYSHPTNDMQLEHNRMILNDLKARCVGEVGEFLAKNKALLSELAAKIAEEKHLNREQIAPFLQRAEGTESLPRCASL